MCQISIYVCSLQHCQIKLRSGTNSHFSSFLRLLRARIYNLSLLTGPQYKSTPFSFYFQDERGLHQVANQFFPSPEKLAQLPLCRFEKLLLQCKLTFECPCETLPVDIGIRIRNIIPWRYICSKKAYQRTFLLLTMWEKVTTLN